MKAMELGRLIRALGLNAIQIRGLECASACALAFLGGVERSAEPGSIGVHKASFTPGAFISTDDAVSAVQELTSQTIRYMIEMGADPALLELSLQYEPDDIRYLSRSEMERHRVVTTVRDDSTPVAQAPTAPPPAPTQQAQPPLDLSIPTALSGRVLHPKGAAPIKSDTEAKASDLVTLRNGDRVAILGTQDRWYRVRADNRTGFMHHTWVFVDQFNAAPFGQRHVQVKSVRTIPEAAAVLQTSAIPLSVYLATNGWFAITLEGTYDQTRATALLQAHKTTGGIPDDSFMTYGTTYARKICCD
ncbi:hypothetical protein FY036_01320 [Mesorhizobium microcysteis]|uniref:SH3 domain-containing protein n=1 Tax=Neoaquamicrobium microcysteis TaxID=2682781 RepID=A0A5D4H9I2_9HYPH|nr:SH3 domain-containing protein [Mesorhizobium microcysteis]TYR36115.1 hypothetical protein FY036_01320 [Mesorhizobium microcysteis]